LPRVPAPRYREWVGPGPGVGGGHDSPSTPGPLQFTYRGADTFVMRDSRDAPSWRCAGGMLNPLIAPLGLAFAFDEWRQALPQQR
jgi:hypothetical protein